MKKLNVISRKYWNRQPCNIKHSKKKLFSKEYFNEVSKKRYFVEGHIKNFVNFKKWRNKKVLEIGFGIGTDAIEFLKNGSKNNQFKYIDEISKNKPNFILTGGKVGPAFLDIRYPYIHTFLKENYYIYDELNDLKILKKISLD